MAAELSQQRQKKMRQRRYSLQSGRKAGGRVVRRDGCGDRRLLLYNGALLSRCPSTRTADKGCSWGSALRSQAARKCTGTCRQPQMSGHVRVLAGCCCCHVCVCAARTPAVESVCARARASCPELLPACSPPPACCCFVRAYMPLPPAFVADFLCGEEIYRPPCLRVSALSKTPDSSLRSRFLSAYYTMCARKARNVQTRRCAG